MHEEQSSRPSWQTIAEAYRAQAAAKIPVEWRLSPDILATISATSHQTVLGIPNSCEILTKEELDITETYDVVSMVKMLSTGKISSYDVTLAFCKRAAIAQQLTNCLTETFFDQALERAKYCDEYLARENKPLGPFHGLPISLKDSFCVKGINYTTGYVSFVQHSPDDHDCALVQILLAQGAVLYVKTNVPQTMMSPDSHNNLFGRTLNPHKLCLTAGGSSGGEGALLAMRGSIIGVGTDIAGSIRIPAYVNGMIGFRPTTRRLPYGGQETSGRPPNFGILATAGPLARSVRDIDYFMTNVLSFDIWNLDEAVISVPWRSLPLKRDLDKTLRLGVIVEDPLLPLHPTVLRIFNSCLSKIQAAGHVLVHLADELPKNVLTESSMIAHMIFSLNPQRTASEHIKQSGEPVIPSLRAAWPRELDDFEPTIDDAFRVNNEQRRIRSLVREQFVKNRLDAIIMPVYQGTAVSHDEYGIPVYTVFANLIDHPACSLPVGKADKQLDAEFLRDVKYIPDYSSEVIEGAPCGLQLIGRPMKDEELVDIMYTISEILDI